MPRKDDEAIHLYLEILNQYMIFFKRKCPSITLKHINSLQYLVREEYTRAAQTMSTATKTFFQSTYEELRKMIDEDTLVLTID